MNEQKIDGTLRETRSTYLVRVLPDLPLIENDIIDSSRPERRDADFSLRNAIARVKKLLEDLERAYGAS